MNKNLTRRTALVAVAGAASLVLAACGWSDDTSAGHNGHSPSPSASSSAPASQGEHNTADVAFAKEMIPHHRQAVEMADLAPTRAESADVKKLADEIKKAQDPEIKTLSGWLTSWGEEVPPEGAMDHSMHSAGSGMMTAEEIANLEKASGKAFDTAFMQLMIKHHEGAVTMAKTEKADGSFPEAKTMADAIITSQTAEIAQMNALLGKS
ncbi:DUF305 domain-containing protein [Streptomyces sp. H34-S4]|uniref:DUF305 domain-containing protein n=1 Tax=Streptomyces sp. H34-S4 TaxID=2996463 RepID=UPI00226E3DE6|nr:DUF305 domain-containing protein [Streptomyces sp. H34-S4]MCY0933898.1 DUF305 domain-containing protein [Streptomyces sp. H34-S4]